MNRQIRLTIILIFGLSGILTAQYYYAPKLSVASPEKSLISWRTEGGQILARFIDAQGNPAESAFPLFGFEYIGFNDQEDFMVSKRVNYSGGEYYEAHFIDYAKIYFSSGDTTQNFSIGGGIYPWCGTGALGSDGSLIGLRDNFLYAFQNEGTFSLKIFNKQGELQDKYFGSSTAYKVEAASLSDSSFLICWFNVFMVYDTDSLQYGIYGLTVQDSMQSLRDSILIREYPDLPEYFVCQEGSSPTFRLSTLSDSVYQLFIFEPDSAMLRVLNLNSSAQILSEQQIPIPIPIDSSDYEGPELMIMNVSNYAAGSRTVYLYAEDYQNNQLKNYSFLLYFNQKGQYTGQMEMETTKYLSESDFKFKTGINFFLNAGLSQKEVYAYRYQNFNKTDSIRVGTITALEKEMTNPVSTFRLYQNYPNPFNPITVINYELQVPGHIKLTVYNALGQKVRTLVNRKQRSGKYSAVFNAGSLSSGVYYYEITTLGSTKIRKMILVH